MALIDRRRTARFPLPHDIIRDVDTVLQVPVYDAGALVAPTGGGASTVTIYDATNTLTSVNAAPVTVSGSIAEYTVTAGTFTADYGRGWRVLWSLDFSGTTVEAENDAVLARKQLWPTITLEDLFRVLPQLDPSVTGQPFTRYTLDQLQDQLDEAWVQLMQRFINEGWRAEWVRSPSSLREPHKFLALALIMEGEAVMSQGDTYHDMARRYRERFDAAYASMTVEPDRDQDGAADTTGREGVGSAGIWLGSGRRWGGYR